MNNIEEKLSNLPRTRLSKKADRNLKVRLFGKMARQEMHDMRFYYCFRREFIATAGLSLLLLTMILTPGYAYASKKVTVGHLLYPVKKSMEKFEYSVSPDKSATLLKFSIRRIEEAEQLAGKSEQEAKLIILMEEARRLREAARSHEEKPSGKVIEEYQEKGDSAIKQVAEKVGTESGDAVIDAVVLTIEEVKKEEEMLPEKKDIEVREKERTVEDIAPKAKPIETPKAEPVPNAIPKTETKKPVDTQIKSPVKQEQPVEKKNTVKHEKEKVIVDLKKEVKKLETTLVNEDYKKEEVEKIVNKINNRIKRAEQEENSEKSKQIIEPIKALTDNAEYFVKKEEKTNINEKEGGLETKEGKNGKKK